MIYRKRQIVLNLSIFFLALVLSLLLGESIVRVFLNGQDKENWVGASKRYYEYDSLLGWVKIPNTDTTRVSLGNKYSVSYQTNSKGIRGPEYVYKKADNEYRVLFLGDSYTEGYLVEFNELFSEVMKSKLNSMVLDKHIEAINFGTAGYSTDQELLSFQNEGKKYNPDITVLMFYQNDVTYNNEPKDWSMYYKPLFKFEGKGLVLTNVPVPRPDNIVNYKQLTLEERNIFKRIRAWLHNNSHLYRFLKERIQSTYLLNKFAVQLHLMDKRIEDDDDMLPRGYRIWQKNYIDSVRDSWRITEALLKQLKEDVDSSGGKLIVFYIPHEASIYDEEWEKIKKRYGFSENEWNIEQVRTELESICRRNGINFMDPTEFFKDKADDLRKDNKRLYEPKDHHWNVEGHYFAGELLADYIAGKYLKKDLIKQ